MSKPDKILVVARDSANPPSELSMRRLAEIVVGDDFSGSLIVPFPVDIFQRIDGVWSYVGPKDPAAVEMPGGDEPISITAERLPDEIKAEIREHCCKDSPSVAPFSYNPALKRSAPAPDIDPAALDPAGRAVLQWAVLLFRDNAGQSSLLDLERVERYEAALRGTNGQGESSVSPPRHNTYEMWANGGGPNECPHGMAAGLTCHECPDKTFPGPQHFTADQVRRLGREASRMGFSSDYKWVALCGGPGHAKLARADHGATMREWTIGSYRDSGATKMFGTLERWDYVGRSAYMNPPEAHLFEPRAAPADATHLYPVNSSLAGFVAAGTMTISQANEMWTRTMGGKSGDRVGVGDIPDVSVAIRAPDVVAPPDEKAEMESFFFPRKPTS